MTSIRRGRLGQLFHFFFFMFLTLGMVFIQQDKEMCSDEKEVLRMAWLCGKSSVNVVFSIGFDPNHLSISEYQLSQWTNTSFPLLQVDILIFALKWYIKSLYRHLFLEDISKHARVTQEMALPNLCQDLQPGALTAAPQTRYKCS